MQVKEFFNSKAEKYDFDRTASILKNQINKEKACVLELLKPKKDELILDAGCGSGHYSLLIKKVGGLPFGIDISEKMIEMLKKNGIDGQVGNLEYFNLDLKFDKIICGGALEFIDSPERALLNFNKHLKNDGKLVLLYPRKCFAGLLYKLYHKTHGINIRLFSEKLIRHFLCNSQFDIVTIKKANMLCSVVKACKK